jgi:hypothetical protein
MHSKLQNYNGRRILQYLKLLMIAAVSRSVLTELELVIRVDDIERARHWLLEAESFMPDIFREMKSKSDFQLIQELHFAMWTVYSARKKAPIHAEFIHAFLAERVPSEKIAKIIETAINTGMIQRLAGTTDQFSPKALVSYGVE